MDYLSEYLSGFKRTKYEDYAKPRDYGQASSPIPREPKQTSPFRQDAGSMIGANPPETPAIPDMSQFMGAPAQPAGVPAQPVANKPVDAFSNYWGSPVVGKMPLDQFVQLAGMASHAFAPDTPMGRLGAGLGKMGGLAYAERARLAEKASDAEANAPKAALGMRLLTAQVEEAEKGKTPSEWEAFYKGRKSTINEKTGQPYTEDEIIKDFNYAKSIPKEPKYITDIQQDPTTGIWQHGRRNEATGIFTADRPATDAEKKLKVTGADKGPETRNFQIGDREVPHQWDEAKKEWIPIKGMGGSKWSPKEGKADKPEMTEPQARDKLFQLAKWEKQLNTGGIDEVLFAMIAKSDPEIAKQMQGADKTDAKKFIDDQRKYYEGFLKKSEPVLGDGFRMGESTKARKGERVPPGFKDTGRTQGGRKVYSDGVNAWVE